MGLYTTKRNYDYLDDRQVWLDKLLQLQSQVIAKFEKVGGHVVSNDLSDGLRVNGVVNVYFRIARLEHAELEHYAPRWMIQRRHLPDGWIIAIRLADRCKSVLDHLLVPTIRTDGNTIRFSEKRRAGLGIVSFETPEALARSLIRRVARSSHVSPSKPPRQRKQLRSKKSKQTTARARR